MKMIVYAPPFDMKSGGNVVLHKLANLLNLQGEETILWLPAGGGTPYDLPTVNECFPGSDDVVIYPEIVAGNPCGAKHVVRWLLYTPSVEFADSDIIISYSKLFSSKHPNAPIVTIIERWPDIFYHKDTIRNGTCFAVRKGINKPRIKETEDQFEIGLDYNFSGLAEIFHSKEFFYSYDDVTFLSLIAALCGCISVVVPREGVEKDEWLDACPYFKYGVAYGVNDIFYAKSTIHLVPDHLKEIEENSLLQVKNFISLIKSSL